MTGTTASRLHYMDAMRSVLMLLGLVVHSARPYDSYDWMVKDAERLPLLDSVGATLHLFRMPAFFVIAGFFGMYLLKRPTVMFLRERMRRVLVPLLAMLVSVNLVQVWFLGRHTEAAAGGFIDGVLIPGFWEGRLTSHLWFLACLALYCAMTAALAPSLRRLAAWSNGSSARAHGVVFFSVMTLAVLAPLAVAVLDSLTAPALSQHVLGLFTLSTALGYLPFFAVGVMLCAFPGLLERFARCGVSVVVLGLCGGAGMYLAPGHEGVAFKALHVVSKSLLTWMTVRAVFSLFRQWADKPSPAFRYLSDASYSMYLFHHLLVTVTATWLLPVGFDAWFKFLIVLTVATLVSLGLHHFLIRRYAWLSYLFNGRALRPEKGVANFRSLLPGTP